MKGRRTGPRVISLIIMIVVLLALSCAAPPAAAPTLVPPQVGVAPPAAAPTPVPPKADKISIALPSKSAGLWWTELGRQKGFFKEEAIELEIAFVKADIAYAGVVSGELPYITAFNIMATDEGFKKLASMCEIVDLPGDGLTTADSTLKGNPGQVKRMIRAALKSLAYYKNNPQELIDFLKKEFSLDQRMAKLTYDDAVATLIFDGDIIKKQVDGFVEVMLFMGFKREQIVLEKGIDLSILKEVQKELKASR